MVRLSQQRPSGSAGAPPGVETYSLTKERMARADGAADAAGAADGGGGGGLRGLAQSMLVPDVALVPQEYWRFRWLTTGLGLVSTVKGALTAQAHMIAIGVGDPDATPLNYLVISEINSALGRFIGLALAASVSSSYFAMHAKPTMVMNATVGKLGSVFPILLLLYPHQLQWISLSEALFGVLLSLMVSPANAALWEHMQLSPDPSLRAKVGQINGNQDRIRTFLHMAVRYYAVFIAFAAPSEDYTYVWVGVIALGLLEAAIEIYRVLIAAPLTFNRARFRLACDAWRGAGRIGAKKGGDVDEGLRQALAPRSIAQQESLWGARAEPWTAFGLGVSVGELLPVPPSSGVPPWAEASLVNRLLSVHKGNSFVLGGDVSKVRSLSSSR